MRLLGKIRLSSFKELLPIFLVPIIPLLRTIKSSYKDFVERRHDVRDLLIKLLREDRNLFVGAFCYYTFNI